MIEFIALGVAAAAVFSIPVTVAIVVRRLEGHHRDLVALWRETAVVGGKPKDLLEKELAIQERRVRLEELDREAKIMVQKMRASGFPVDVENL